MSLVQDSALPFQNTTLTNIDLSIDFVRNDMFAPRINFGVGPSWSAGINTMNGFVSDYCCLRSHASINNLTGHESLPKLGVVVTS